MDKNINSSIDGISYKVGFKSKNSFINIWKKQYYINILGIITFILLSGCSPELEEPEKKEFHEEFFSKTKSMSTLDDYWDNGNKIPLTKLPNKKFVILKADIESSFQNNLKTKGITLNIKKFTSS